MALIDEILAANAQSAVQGQQVQSDIAEQALSGVPPALADFAPMAPVEPEVFAGPPVPDVMVAGAPIPGTVVAPEVLNLLRTETFQSM